MSSTAPNSTSPAPSSRRLLLVKFGAIGDVVMAIPAAYAMHRAGYAVDWVCSAAVAPILERYPWIRPILCDDRKLLRGSVSERVVAILSLWRQLAGVRYDLCATLYQDSRYKLLTLPVRARRKFLLSRLDRSTHLLPGRHHTDEYARILLANSFAPQPDGETPTQLSPIPITGLPPNPLPFDGGRPRIVIVPAGARNTLRDDALRRWPVELYVQLTGAILALGCEVVLAGGPDDAWASPHFADLPITDLTGKLSLLQMLALLDSATIAITHDTGPLHLAGLTSTAVIGIFGPTDPRGRLPQRSNCTAIWGGEGFACRPCYDGRDYAPCTHNGCMTQVTAAMVLTEVNILIAAIRAPFPLLPRIVTPTHTPLVEISPVSGARP
jgi:heptosyltransferase-2